MEREELTGRVIRSFQGYYNVREEDIPEPFVAEAVYESHDVGYFLIKAAKISESDSSEYVYFASEDMIDKERFQELDERAWTLGLSHCVPRSGHKNTDVSLILIADQIPEDVMKAVKKQRRYQSYRHGFWGFSQYRLVAIESSTEKVAYNRQGETLKKLIGNILKHK